MDWFRNMQFAPSSTSTYLISEQYDTHDETNSTVLVNSVTDDDCMSFSSGSSSCIHSSQDSFEFVSNESHKTDDSDDNDSLEWISSESLKTGDNDDNETYNNTIFLSTNTLTNEEVHDPIGSTIRVPFKISTTIVDSMYLQKYSLRATGKKINNPQESSVSKHVSHVNSTSKSVTCHATHNPYSDSSADRNRNIVLDQNSDYRKVWRDRNKSVKEHRFSKGTHYSYSKRSTNGSWNIVLDDQNIDYRKAWQDRNKSLKALRFWKGPNISHSNNRPATTSIQRIASIVRCGDILQSEFKSVAKPIKVFIVRGVYKGRTGTFVKQTEIFTQVILDRMTIPVYVLSDEVKMQSSSHDISRRTYNSKSFQSHGETKTSYSALASTITSHNKHHEVSDWNNSSLRLVEVVGGKYKGHSGILIKNTDRRSQVLINGTNTVVYLKQDNVSLIHGIGGSTSVNGSKTCSSSYGGVQRIESIDSYKTSGKYPVHDLDLYDARRVHIIGGKYEGQYAWFVKHTAKRTQVVIAGTTTRVNLLPENVSMIGKNNQQRTTCESNRHECITYEPVRVESSQRTTKKSSKNLGYNVQVQDDMSYQTSYPARNYDSHCGKSVRIVASVKNVVSDDETSVHDKSKCYYKKEPTVVHRTISKSQGNSKIAANQKGLATMDPMYHHHSAANSCSCTIVSYYSATSSSDSESSDSNNEIYDYDKFVKNYNRSLVKESKRRAKSWSSIGMNDIVKSKESHPLPSKMGNGGHKLDNRKDNTLRPSDNQYVFVDYDDETYETCKSFT